MAIVVGGVAGWLAEKLMRSDMGVLANIVLGIIGAFIGNFCCTQLGYARATGLLGNLVVATLGTVLVILVYRVATGRRAY